MGAIIINMANIVKLVRKIFIVSCLICCWQQAVAKKAWDADYFPNTVLTTHNGQQVKFFDDLIEDKIVAINFIYTTCPDTCPLETAQLVKVQEILGDRVGNDVHIYSITIDPDTDTPEVLKKYRENFGANWTFLTGKKQEIIDLRKKLGLYIDGVDDGPNKNNHNVSMIIGNQSTGRWMKRSPFENPYVLADQIGNWLTGWKAKQQVKDYAAAPELRGISQGEQLYRTRCAACHTIDGRQKKGAIGPDLLGVTKRRDFQWLVRWLKEPDKMIEEKDPIAVALLDQYKVPMPNMRLNKQEVLDVMHYMDEVSTQKETVKVPRFRTVKGELIIKSAWIKEAPPNASVNAGYMMLVNSEKQLKTLQRVESSWFDRVEIHEMAMDGDGMMEMRELEALQIPAGDRVELKPGGKHLMLIDPTKPVKVGDKIDLLLTYENGATQSINVYVNKP